MNLLSLLPAVLGNVPEKYQALLFSIMSGRQNDGGDTNILMKFLAGLLRDHPVLGVLLSEDGAKHQELLALMNEHLKRTEELGEDEPVAMALRNLVEDERFRQLISSVVPESQPERAVIEF